MSFNCSKRKGDTTEQFFFFQKSIFYEQMFLRLQSDTGVKAGCVAISAFLKVHQRNDGNLKRV